MTTREWAKMYPEIAARFFECSVDDLDNVIDDLERKPMGLGANEIGYLTKADVDKLMEISSTHHQSISLNYYPDRNYKIKFNT